MASHRRPKERGLAGTTARTAAGLALAGAASVTLFGEAGHAEPRLTTDEARARVDRLYEEAEQATERYNGAKEKADTATGRIERLQDELARRTERLNVTRDGLGSSPPPSTAAAASTPPSSWPSPPPPATTWSAPGCWTG